MSFQDFKQNTTRALVSKTIDEVLNYVNKDTDREKAFLKLTDISEKLMDDKFSHQVFENELIKATGAQSTDLESPENVWHLCGKCDAYARNWAPTAAKLREEFPQKA